LQKAKNSIEDLDLLVQIKNWDKESFGDVGDVEENYGEDLVEEIDHNQWRSYTRAKALVIKG